MFFLHVSAILVSQLLALFRPLLPTCESWSPHYAPYPFSNHYVLELGPISHFSPAGRPANPITMSPCSSENPNSSPTVYSRVSKVWLMTLLKYMYLLSFAQNISGRKCKELITLIAFREENELLGAWWEGDFSLYNPL